MKKGSNLSPQTSAKVAAHAKGDTSVDKSVPNQSCSANAAGQRGSNLSPQTSTKHTAGGKGGEGANGKSPGSRLSGSASKQAEKPQSSGRVRPGSAPAGRGKSECGIALFMELIKHNYR